MAVQFVTNDKVAETSSKGNQEKWKDGGRWYKLDQFGYEGLAETVILKLSISVDTFHARTVCRPSPRSGVAS